MGEIIACATNPLVSKLYLNAICKVPAALPAYSASDETRETVARIHAYALHAISLFESEDYANGVCLKEVESIKKTYKWPTEAGDVPNDEELDGMAVGLLENLEAFCAGFPQPFTEAISSGAGTGTGVRGDDDSSDEDFDEAGVAAEVIATGQRRLPARRGRTKVDMGELSEDDEDHEIKKLDFEADADDAEDGGEAMGEREDGGQDDDDDDDDEDDDDDDHEDGEYAADQENSTFNSPAPTPKSGSRSRGKQRRQSLASVAALGEALSSQARI
jgi:hypothetical protein